MTEEVNVHGEVSGISKAGQEVEGHRDVELENDPALEKEEVVIDNGDLKDDADGSYVFVSGSGVVAAEDDPVESDLCLGDCRAESNGGEHVASYSVDNNGAASEGSGDPGENNFPIDHPHNKFDGERFDVDDPIEELSLHVSQAMGSEPAECEREQFTEKDCADGSMVYAGPVEDDWETKTNSIISADGKNIGWESESQSLSDVKESKGFENVVCAHVQNGLGEETEMREYVEIVGAESESISVRDVEESQKFNNLVGADVKIGSGEEMEPSEHCEGNESVSVTYVEESQEFNNNNVGQEKLREYVDSAETAESESEPVSVTERQEFKIIAGADAQNLLAEENELSECIGEILVEGKPGNKLGSAEEESVQDLATDSCNVADMMIETVITNGTVAEEKELGECIGENPVEGKPGSKLGSAEVESVQDLATDYYNVSDMTIEAVITNGTVTEEKDLSECIGETPVEEVGSVQDLATDSCNVADMMIETVITNGTVAEEKELSECIGEIPVDGKLGSKRGSAEEESVQDLAIDSCNVTDVMIETVITNGTVAEEKELSECIGEVPVEPGSKLESAEEESVQDLATDSRNVADMMIETAITNGTVAEEKELSECIGEVPVEGEPGSKLGSAEEELVQDLATDSCNVADMMIETVITNGTVAEEKKLSECINEVPVEGKPVSKLGSVEEESVQDLPTDSCNVADMMTETVVTNGTVSNEHSTGYTQDRGSTDFDSDQVAGEHNISSESMDCELGSNDFIEGASLQNGPVESVKTSYVSLKGENALIESNECDIHDEKVEISPACIMDEGDTGTESGTLGAKMSGITDSDFVPETKFEIESDDSLLVDNNEPTYPSDHAITHGGTSSIDSSTSGGKLDNDAETDVKSPANDLTENETDMCNCSVAGVQLVPEEGNTSALNSTCAPEDSIVTSDCNDNAVVSEGTPSFDVPVNGEVDQFTSSDGPEEAGVASGIHGDENLRPIEEGSTVDIFDGQNMDAEVGKRPLRPFYFLIRLPRYDDENTREQIKYAQFLVDEKTKSRDAIRAEIQIKKAACKECSQDVEAAKSAERSARDALKSKRQEMDSVQSMVNRLNNAISVEDIAGRIRNFEHMIEHVTLPLKEEKQLLRQIKQLKQHREELSSNMGKQDELQQSLDHKDGIEEQSKRLQLFRKEVELLRQNLVRAEAGTKAAKRRYDEEYCKLSELLAQFKAADDVRQDAYAKLQVLRKELYEKTKYFRDYKLMVNKATELAAEGNREELQRFCVDQVERIMELWNKNDEFRSDYVRCNTRSTLRRLRTLDGRSLGPDEEPPVIPNVFNERASKNNLLSLHSTLEQEKKVVSVETVKIEDEVVSKVEAVVERSQTPRSKKPAKPAPVHKSLVVVSSWNDAEGVREEPTRTKEEEELILKAEEIRKEEEAVKLKEKRRLDEMAKAKEAMQRKKRNADKAEQRAALRAQKEAEQKEKEREKRARKKEKRKETAIDTANIAEGESAAPSSEITSSMEECDLGDTQVEVTKRLQKPSQFIKQTKAKSIPLPLRNRGKRRMQLWMWVLITILVVVALSFLGSSTFSWRSGLPGSGF